MHHQPLAFFATVSVNSTFPPDTFHQAVSPFTVPLITSVLLKSTFPFLQYHQPLLFFANPVKSKLTFPFWMHHQPLAFFATVSVNSTFPPDTFHQAVSPFTVPLITSVLLKSTFPFLQYHQPLLFFANPVKSKLTFPFWMHHQPLAFFATVSVNSTCPPDTFHQAVSPFTVPLITSVLLKSRSPALIYHQPFSFSAKPVNSVSISPSV